MESYIIHKQGGRWTLSISKRGYCVEYDQYYSIDDAIAQAHYMASYGQNVSIIY